jgi:uncharacterized protein (DUF1015 family)
MAEIAPFYGLRYNLEKIESPEAVVTPPYDVISPEEQEMYHRRSIYNMVRLELGMKTPSDDTDNNPHTRAAENLRTWWREGVLVREDQPAIYHYELDYTVGDEERRTRKGFIALLRLEDFDSGRVRPHEKTFQAVKDERLALMQACPANLSPVFALYPDPEGYVDRRLEKAREAKPLMSFGDRRGMEHRLYRVTDPGAQAAAKESVKDRAFFIADGHHRYETALKYRDMRRQQEPDAGPDAPFEFVMVYLSNMNDEGLTILPTHRLLRNLGDFDAERFLQRAGELFEIREYSSWSGGEWEWRTDLAKGREKREIRIGFHWRGGDRFILFRPDQEAVEERLRRLDVPEILRSMDVVVLDRILLQEVLGLSSAFLADHNNIQFDHAVGEGLEKLRAGTHDAGFFVNATRIGQVKRVAEAGLTMPHKATYFFPKVKSGLVIHPIVSGEQVPKV